MTSPSQTISYLGVHVDSTTLSIAVPEEKLVEIKSLCSSALSADSIILRSLASLLGNLPWAINAIPFSQSRYRDLQRLYIRACEKCDNNLNSFWSISSEARAELQWWAGNLSQMNGKRIFPQEVDLTIFSDASLNGWGALCNGITTRGPWRKKERESMHINELELLTAFNALVSFAPLSRDISMKLFLDNSTAVYYINNGGGTRSRPLTRLAKRLADWCASKNISVMAIYLPGLQNDIAEKESRERADSSDWMLNPAVFSHIRDL